MFADTRFVITDSDRKEYELIPGGRNVTLTWQNRKLFCKSLVEYRKSEFTLQCNAMRRGLATVVPYTMLSLFTWEELELEVCGVPTMDLDLLQKMTTYSGCSQDEPHVQYFWTIMRQRFDERDRAKFLKFVWGRSRLPVRAQDFPSKFQINALPKSANNPDGYMPIGHTWYATIVCGLM